MAKCIKCGKSFFGRGKIKLADAEICFKCYDELGFDHKIDIYGGSRYRWDEIKEGRDVLNRRKWDAEATKEAAALGLNLKLYRQINRAEATDPEIRLLGAICAVLEDEGRDTDVIDAALGDNGSLLLMVDGVVFIEYKAEPNVKWIRFDNEGEDKVRISGPGRINSLAARVVSAFDAVAD